MMGEIVSEMLAGWPLIPMEFYRNNVLIQRLSMVPIVNWLTLSIHIDSSVRSQRDEKK